MTGKMKKTAEIRKIGQIYEASKLKHFIFVK